MPEFRDRYDSAAVSGRISQPPFAELVHRGRRRARRTRAARLAGVAVVAALAATSLLAMPSQTGPSTPAATSPPGLEPGVWSVAFFDIDHGIAVNWDQRTCTHALFVTDDGGSTWSEPLDVPGFPGRERIEAKRYCLIADVIPVGPRTLVLPVHPGIEHEYVSERMEPPTMSYISHDAGRTWRAYELETRTADTVPDGVFPVPYCEARFEPGEYDSPANDWCVGRPRFSWYDPQTGHRMVLRNNPQAETLYTPEVAGDGSIWAGGIDAHGNPHISVSRDRGRTWLDVSPPPPEDVDEPTAATVAAADGDTAYFYSTTESAWPPASTEIYRTIDGGETWRELAAQQPFVDLGSMWVTRDGSLLVDRRPVGTTQEISLSRDGGATFELMRLRATPTKRIVAGFYGNGFDLAAGSRIDAVSEDGLTWHEFDRPAFRLPQ